MVPFTWSSVPPRLFTKVCMSREVLLATGPRLLLDAADTDLEIGARSNTQDPFSLPICDQREMPLLPLQETFQVGKRSERMDDLVSMRRWSDRRGR